VRWEVGRVVSNQKAWNGKRDSKEKKTQQKKPPPGGVGVGRRKEGKTPHPKHKKFSFGTIFLFYPWKANKSAVVRRVNRGLCKVERKGVGWVGFFLLFFIYNRFFFILFFIINRTLKQPL